MDEALNQIQQLANERLNLYLLAGHQHLTPEQAHRLGELNARLPILWDQHRREYASRKWDRTIGYKPERAAA